MHSVLVLVFTALLSLQSTGFSSARNIKRTESDRTLSEGLCNRLWTSDRNRFVEGRDYILNIQGKTSSRKEDDKAPKNLFYYVDHSKLFGKQTVSDLYHEFDHALYTGDAEVVTKEEITDDNRFLKNIMRTRPMKIAHNYLVRQGLVPRSQIKFRNKLKQMWFDFYKRRVANDSSGFEHVFIGEIMRKGASRLVVGGLHNWVNYYYHEQFGYVDYKGYIYNKKTEPRGVTIRFVFHNVSKPIGGFFVGTSPAFEMALYTICFLKFPNGDCACRINDESFRIKTYQMRGSPQYVGTAYPIFG